MNVTYKYDSIANCFSKTNDQHDIPNVNQWFIAYPLPIGHKVFNTRLNNESNNI